MKFSISNLAWGKTPLNEVIPILLDGGIEGIEIAPTAIWPNLDKLQEQEILELKNYLQSHGLIASGIQSLLFGHPELQLFDEKSWPMLESHMRNMIRIGGMLGAEVAVFGSPKNRLKGDLESSQADELAKKFLERLIPYLKEYEVILTIEPNAPDYGADYLTTYEDVLSLCDEISSKFIQPQIDTGCLWLVDRSPVDAFNLRAPHHIHLSTPYLEEVPGKYDFETFLDLACLENYAGWSVIEMLPTQNGNPHQISDSLSLISHRSRIK